MGLNRANFRLVINGEDKTSLFKTRFISLQVCERQGELSDTIDIEVDNRDKKIVLPSTGATIEVSVGYGDDLVAKGAFEVDELEEPIEVDTIRIHGKAAKLKESFKAPKNAVFDDISLGDLAQGIASEHGFEAAVSSKLANIQFAHIDQIGESDMSLLSRLTAEHGGMVKPTSNRLVLLTKDEAKKVSGAEISAIEITDPKDSTGRLVIAERSNFKQVKAHWFDEVTQQRQELSAGSGEPSYVMRQRFQNQARAQAMASAKLKSLQRDVKTLTLTRQLMPRVIAEGKVEISNHKTSINGTWIAEEVTHTILSGEPATTKMMLHPPT